MKLKVFALFAFLASCAYYPDAHRGVVWYDVDAHELEAPGLALSCLHRHLSHDVPDRPFEGVRVAWVDLPGTALTVIDASGTLVLASRDQRAYAVQVLAHEFVHVFLLRHRASLRDQGYESSERGHHEWMFRHGVCFGGCADVEGTVPSPGAYSRQCQERI